MFDYETLRLAWWLLLGLLRRMRMVTHCDVSADDCGTAVEAVRDVLADA